jgi:hypothetical protein
LISQLLIIVTNEERRHTAMSNNYEVPEVVEMGRAQDVILGDSKIEPNCPDSPGQPDRDTLMDDE